MSYKRKTRDEWQLWTNYGYGWECEVAEETRSEIKQRYREYMENAYQLKGIKIKKCRIMLTPISPSC